MVRHNFQITPERLLLVIEIHLVQKKEKHFEAIPGKIAAAKYPNFQLAENHTGTIIDIIHERGRDAPLAKIRFEDGTISHVPTVLGSEVGTTIDFGLKSKIDDGNVISIQNIPDGTTVCNVERYFGDGGALIKSAGTSATIFSHNDDGVVLKLQSGKFTTLNAKNRAMIGTLAGGGANGRPFMSAGGKWRKFRSRGRKYPIVRGVAQAAYVHPHWWWTTPTRWTSTVSRDAWCQSRKVSLQDISHL